MTCKAPPYFINGHSLPERGSDSSRSSTVPLGSLRPTRPDPHGPGRFLLPAWLGAVDTKQSPQPASGSPSVRSPASPRLPSSLKGSYPSLPTSTSHEGKTEHKSDALAERRAEASHRLAGDPGTLRLRHVARKGPADAIGKRPSPASQSVG